MTRQDRHRQLLDAAWRLVRQEGAQALTLGRLAEQAGVTKPVVYDQFGTRTGLLAALYQEFDARQTARMESALAASAPSLADRAAVIASAYVDCVLAQGREASGVIAALGATPELDKVKRECEAIFMDLCRGALAPFAAAGVIAPAALRAMLGAAEALSNAAVAGELTVGQAKDELFETIIAMMGRAARPAGRAAR
ncbi:TetR/AcrR family transcriptional regulator [Variovorax sp. LARHSF232]